MSEQSPEGWKWIRQRKKWHYFVDGRSLCGAMRSMAGTFNLIADGGPDGCKICQMVLSKRKGHESK